MLKTLYMFRAGSPIIRRQSIPNDDDDHIIEKEDRLTVGAV
jgi:hypothetical protein